MDSSDRDAVIGAGVIVVGALVLALAYGTAGSSTVPGYDLTAQFNKAEGITLGSEVRLAGLKVGKVVAQKLDDQFHAVVTMRVAPGTEVPDDSAALIQTDGLLGAKYIALQPGADETNLKPGDRIQYTQDSLDVQELLSLIIAQAEAKRAGGDKAGGAAQ